MTHAPTTGDQLTVEQLSELDVPAPDGAHVADGWTPGIPEPYRCISTQHRRIDAADVGELWGNGIQFTDGAIDVVAEPPGVSGVIGGVGVELGTSAQVRLLARVLVTLADELDMWPADGSEG